MSCANRAWDMERIQSRQATPWNPNCVVLGLIVFCFAAHTYYTYCKRTNPGRMLPVFVSSLLATTSSSQTGDEHVKIPKTETAKKNWVNLSPCPSGHECKDTNKVSDEAKAHHEATALEFVKDNPNAVIMIFAPWCPHCKVMMVEFVKASEQCDKKFGILNGEMVRREFLMGPAAPLNVTHFPYVCKLRAKPNNTALQVDVYDGPPTAEGVLNFAKSDELSMLFE